MKQDIRKLFGEDNTKVPCELPSGHRKEFQNKLQSRQKKFVFGPVSRAAAIALVILGTTIGLYNTHNQVNTDKTTTSQINSIEKEYLKNIESEWQKFISVTNDSTLIRRFDSKLKDLDEDYNKLTEQLKSNPENTIIIESLIDNLQTRLEILEDIQTHIQILNSKPSDHGNIL